MKTIIKKVDKHQIEEETIVLAGQILKAGGLVAFPTETVYGLGANALDEEAALKTYEAKGRPSDNPLIVHIADIQVLEEIVTDIPEVTRELANRFWPGPLTMIFDKSEKVPYGTTGGLDTVAVRMPDDLIAQKLITAGGGFISAPSANTSGRPSPTTAEHVVDDLDGKIEMILDGGAVTIGVESTILDMTVTPPIILRPGAITKEMLETVIKEIAVDVNSSTKAMGQAPKAPGMKYRHYAPEAQMNIIEGELEETVKAIKQLTYERAKAGYSVGIMATNETMNLYTHGIIKSIGTRDNENSIAKNIYRVLREFDKEKVSYIYSEAFAMSGIGYAIMNRLEKASGHLIVQAAEITKLQMYRKIIFVSSSDNSRGPMAATLLKHQELVREYEIESRGLIVLFPEPPNPKAEVIMKSQKMSLSDHVARKLLEEDLAEDALIIAIDENVKWKIASEYQNIKHVFTLGEYIDDTTAVPSAYGQPLVEYGESYEIIKRLIVKLANRLNQEVQE